MEKKTDIIFLYFFVKIWVLELVELTNINLRHAA